MAEGTESWGTFGRMSQRERSRRFRERHRVRIRREAKEQRERRAEAQAQALTRDLLGRCDPLEFTSCLIWSGAKSKGYGVVNVAGCVFKVHRLTYEQAFGPIPDGREIHHTCGRRACAEPSHLKPLTTAEHMAEDGRLDALAARASDAARARWG